MTASAKPANAPAATPMMAQYLDIKAAHKDALLFYRMGDFYELFFDDAVVAAAALDITLTQRGQHLGQDVPMCGVPVHAAENYLERLIRHGHRVAVCEQMEDPAEAKKRGAKAVVARDVVRLVTPGTLSEEALLDARANNFLAALAPVVSDLALAWLDMSTGTFAVCHCDAEGLGALLARLSPSEILLPADFDADFRADYAVQETEILSSESAAHILSDYFNVASPSLLGDLSRAHIAACGTLLAYLQQTQIAHMPRLARPHIEAPGHHLGLDAATRANLELTRTQTGEKTGSLLATIDMTVSAAGARELADRLAAPLGNMAEICARHRAVRFFVDENAAREDMRGQLKNLPDMMRALSRLVLARGGPRDLQALAVGLHGGEAVRARLSKMSSPADLPDEISLMLAPLTCFGSDEMSERLAQLVETLQVALGDTLPVLARDGGFVRDGYHAPLDQARELSRESRRVIAGLQARYSSETEIKALKIKHNGVLGYHIEVPAQHGDRLMAPPLNEIFIHRQTLANSVRFSSEELSTLAGKISRAGETALALETEIFEQLREQAVALADQIEACAKALAALDVTTALATLAVARDWVQPEMRDDLVLDISGGRHPVVEAALLGDGGGPFIPNDCALDGAAGAYARLTLLTGPNMAGKSTYLRQNALIAILAHMGSFVPARAAQIGLVDRVFSRVGAADDLARGRSTFMVEMMETATILNQASPRALVILDEIGRGTATFDGLSIAWAAVEYLHDIAGCRTLFATHYHELTGLGARLDGLANASMLVREHDGELVFLHEVGAGAADRSYGIHVAELAGLPATVITRARAVLALLEENRAAADLVPALDELPLFTPQSIAAPEADKLREALAALDPDRLSPREALDWLYRLRALMSPDKDGNVL
ncbi:MAG TPA: DNA mismatch repair protein MutS [Rhodobiaceae bacterium]|nr:DNA mismatch repair protein MutS [Rhodobiaceae bacterium]